MLAACQGRDRVAHLDQGGHGVMLSPLPPGLDGVLGEMLNDPALRWTSGFGRLSTSSRVSQMRGAST